MGRPAAAGGARRVLLETLRGATERSAPLRENVLRSCNVKGTGSQRTLAVHEAEQEVLAGADRDNSGFVWCVAGIGQRLGDCAIHLHTLLGSRGPCFESPPFKRNAPSLQPPEGG